MNNWIPKLDKNENAFDFLRLFFACCVVYAHSRYLYGAPDILHWQAKWFDNLHAGTVAVWGFFAVSGYLITQSWQNSKNAGEFFRKRVLRIFPGFWTSLIMCAFFFAPLWYALKHATLTGFITNHGIDSWLFIKNNFTTSIGADSIGDVIANTVNGPLWTINHELTAYIFLGFIGIMGLLNPKSRLRWIALIVAITINSLYALNAINTEFSTTFVKALGDPRALLFYTIFMWGACLHRYKELLPLTWIGMLISAIALTLGTTYNFLPVVLPLGFSYIVISLGYIIPIKNIAKKMGDLSYGIYLYHWPVRLTLETLGLREQMGMWAFITLNLIITLPLAIASWNLVEKRFLKRAPH